MEKIAGKSGIFFKRREKNRQWEKKQKKNWKAKKVESNKEMVGKTWEKIAGKDETEKMFF